MNNAAASTWALLDFILTIYMNIFRFFFNHFVCMSRSTTKIAPLESAAEAKQFIFALKIKGFILKLMLWTLNYFLAFYKQDHVLEIFTTDVINSITSLWLIPILNMGKFILGCYLSPENFRCHDKLPGSAQICHLSRETT